MEFLPVYCISKKTHFRFTIIFLKKCHTAVI